MTNPISWYSELFPASFRLPRTSSFRGGRRLKCFPLDLAFVARASVGFGSRITARKWSRYKNIFARAKHCCWVSLCFPTPEKHTTQATLDCISRQALKNLSFVLISIFKGQIKVHHTQIGLIQGFQFFHMGAPRLSFSGIAVSVSSLKTKGSDGLVTAGT